MSLFDTFDPHSEELIKVNQQRSFREIEDFPKVVIGAFKEETFQVLEHVCSAEQIAALREGRTIPVYRMNWNSRDIGLFHSLVGGAAVVCLLEQLIARGAKKILLYGNCGVLNQEIATTICQSVTLWRFQLAKICRESWMGCIFLMSLERFGQRMPFTGRPGTTWKSGKQMAALPWIWNVRLSWRLVSSGGFWCISSSMQTTAWTATGGIPGHWGQDQHPATKSIFGLRWK